MAGKKTKNPKLEKMNFKSEAFFIRNNIANWPEHCLKNSSISTGFLTSWTKSRDILRRKRNCTLNTPNLCGENAFKIPISYPIK